MSEADLVTGYALRELERGHIGQRKFFFCSNFNPHPRQPDFRTKREQNLKSAPSPAQPWGRATVMTKLDCQLRHRPRTHRTQKSDGEHKPLAGHANRGANHTQHRQTAELPHLEAAAGLSTVARATVADEYECKGSP